MEIEEIFLILFLVIFIIGLIKIIKILIDLSTSINIIIKAHQNKEKINKLILVKIIFLCIELVIIGGLFTVFFCSVFKRKLNFHIILIIKLFMKDDIN